jgi:hypothetical protein
MSKGRGPLTELAFKGLRGLNHVLSKMLKVRLIREVELYPSQIDRAPQRALLEETLPPGAEDYLQADNPRLKELTDAYVKFDKRVTTPAVWTEGKLVSSDLLYFRGQNPFVWQIGRDFADFRYVLSYYALKCSTAADLLAAMEEDGSFGVHTVEIDGRLVSRDLLDSVREVDFIRRHVGLDATILDIGAGYGRLVHRLKQGAGDTLRVYATDAFAPSTFVSEYYMRFRGLPEETVIPLPGVEAFLTAERVNLAVNIHSFSECTLGAIDWWMSLLSKNRVKYLLVIPNARDDQNGACLTNAGENMETIFARHGYAIEIREPRFVDPLVQQYGIDASYLNLFRLVDEA